MKNISPFTLDDQGPVAYFKVAAGLPVWAGFSTRIGGQSLGPYAGANMAYHVGDRRETVRANRRQLAAAVTGGRVDDFCTVSQVHGRNCFVVADHLPASGRPPVEADALVTARPGILLGILTADCLPVIIVDRRCRAVAVVHAGWRGLLAGVVPATLEVLERRYGIGAADLRVYCGPAIGRCCYRVGDEVVEQFAARPPFDRDDSWLHRLPAGCRLDLVRLQLLQLWACGLPREGVSVLSACTACDNFFFSYRRDRGITGRQIAFAGLVGAAG